MALIEAHNSEVANFPPLEECLRQIQKILHSASFRNASMLQHLLQYLAAKAYDSDSETLKEYTIGVEAFSRPQDFDPKTDTIVRVQIHRLRQKLKEYYDSDGIHDPIWIDIPKGHYLPTFEIVGPADGAFGREAALKQVSAPSNELHADETGVSNQQKGNRIARPLILKATVAAAVMTTLFLAGLWVGSMRSRSVAATPTTASNWRTNLDKSPDPVKTFWASFLGNDQAPVIAYPDAVFLLDNFNDLFRFRQGATDFRGAPVDPHVAQEFASNPALVAKAGQLYYENSYLGFGELQAVGMLSNLFGQMGLKPVIKPSREITVDDLKQHNVIMLGSSSQNIAVAHFSTMGDFSFENPNGRLEQWRGMIVNAHPRPNEASVYRTERDPNTKVLKADYSLITVQPGIVPGRYIVDLGGLDTTGSEGAVLFATSRQGVEALAQAIPLPANPNLNGAFPSFQALLRVSLDKGYDVLGATLLTVHPLSPSPAEAANNSTIQK